MYENLLEKAHVQESALDSDLELDFMCGNFERDIEMSLRKTREAVVSQ